MAKSSRSGKSIHSLDELTFLKSQLETARLEKEQKAKQEREEKEKAEREAGLFQDFVKDVTPIKPVNKKLLRRRKPQTTPNAINSAQTMSERDILSDNWDGQHLLETDDPFTYRKNGVSKDTLRKLGKGEWLVQAQIDLHGHRTDEARIAVTEFVHACSESGLRCVRIIHGKGLGSKGDGPVIKTKIVGWLLQMKEVLAFSPAPAKDGGEGALLILLKLAQKPK